MAASSVTTSRGKERHLYLGQTRSVSAEVAGCGATSDDRRAGSAAGPERRHGEAASGELAHDRT